MPVDTGIYSNLLRAPKSIADYDAEAQAMQGNALAMQMRRAQLEDNALSRRQGMEAQQRNALVREAQRKAAEGAGGDELAYVRNMRLSGMPELMDPADKAEKSITERANVTSQIAGRTSENAKRDTDTAIARVGQWRDFVDMAQNPQQAAALVQLMHADPALKDTPIAKAPLEQVLGMLQSKPFDQWKAEFALGAKDFIEKNKPTYQQQNLGGTMRTVALPGLGGAPSVVSEAPITQSADNKASVGASYANAAATRSIAAATRDAAKITADAKSETDIRKEFADLPEVKKYKNAIPAYQAVVKAAQTNNPQADINLIYGLAKLYDPDSVVREGEYDTIANSQSIPEWLKGQAQRLAGGGKLTKETKNQIIEQAGIRIGAYKSEVDGARQSFEGITTRRGLDPQNVFPAVGEQVRGAGGGLSAAEKAELEQLRKQFPGRK